MPAPSPRRSQPLKTLPRSTQTIVTTWIDADAGHIEGLSTYPDEWERRVISFLDDSLALGVTPVDEAGVNS